MRVFCIQFAAQPFAKVQHFQTLEPDTSLVPIHWLDDSVVVRLIG